MRSYFWPFTRVQNRNEREVTTKCGDFFRPKETKGREDSIWFPGSEKLSLFSLPAGESPETACESQRWIGYVNMPLTTGKKPNCGARLSKPDTPGLDARHA